MYRQLATMLNYYRLVWERVPGNSEVKVECPQCETEGRTFQDKKLYVNYIDRVFFCQRCSWKGTLEALALYLRIRSGNVTGPLASSVPSLDQLSDQLTDLQRHQIRVERRESLLPKGTCIAWDNVEARHYLKSRRIFRAQAESFGLLYAPEGYFARRVLIPICDYFGEFCTFVARAIDPGAQKKYLFPRGCRASSLLFNAHQVASCRLDTVWITEGVFDAIHCSPMAVATFGKHISDSQIRVLRHMRPKAVVLLWDWDAWAKTPDLWGEAVLRLKKYFQTFPVKLPRPDSDPTDYFRSALMAMVDEAEEA